MNSITPWSIRGSVGVSHNAKITSHGIVPRTARAAAVSAALVALATACSGEQPTEPTAPTTSSSGSSSAAVTSAGRPDVTAPGIDLPITDAVAHLGASRSGDLTMTVRNGGNAPEHLDMVAAPDGNRGTVRGGHAVDGSMTSAGILRSPAAPSPSAARDRASNFTTSTGSPPTTPCRSSSKSASPDWFISTISPN